MGYAIQVRVLDCQPVEIQSRDSLFIPDAFDLSAFLAGS